MATKNRQELKDYFKIGKRPTQEQFADLIDSLLNKQDDAISVDANDNVGIGTITPEARFEVRDQGGGIDIYRATDATGQHRWRINENFELFLTDATGQDSIKIGQNNSWFDTGNVGIGTTNPSYKFQVKSDESGLFFDDWSGTAALYIDGADGDGVGSDYATLRQDGLNFDIYNHGNLAFRIDSSGNIGIGTTDPQGKLDIAGPIRYSGLSTGTILFGYTEESGTPTGDGFRIRYNSDFFGAYLDALIFEKTDGNDPNPDGGIAFVNTGSDGVEELAMAIRGNGNIGIGTATPAAGMHMYQDRYTLYGPNTGWGAYLQVGGNGRQTTYASVAATNGNLHLDAQDGYQLYLNYYSQGNTIINENAGNVGIGTYNPTQKLHVNGNALKTLGGSLWVVPSDKRIKKDIKPFKDSLKLLKKVMPVWYQYNGKAETDDTDKNVGIIAQEIQEIFPYMVSEYKAKLNPSDTATTDLLSFDGSALKFVIINAIKELDARLTALEAQRD